MAEQILLKSARTFSNPRRYLLQFNDFFGVVPKNSIISHYLWDSFYCFVTRIVRLEVGSQS